jgi:5-methylcytosine-specific restriction endonuclease McrA
MRFCLSPRCPDVVEGRDSYCAQHKPFVEPWAGSKSEARGWEWTRKRRQALRRDGHRCTAVQDGHRCTETATEVDAIVPSAEGGSHLDLTNLRSLCSGHHKAKTEQDRLAGIARRKARRQGSKR